MSGGFYGSGGGSGGFYGSGGSSSSPKPHHGLFHKILSGAGHVGEHLVEDAAATAKGIPMGMIDFAKHPIRTGRLVLKATGQEYSPLIHGHFKQFFRQVEAHPLQPLLDALSVGTLVFGGLGAGIKGASTLAEVGNAARLGEAVARGADAAEAANAPGLYRLAEHFRGGTAATTRHLPTDIAGHDEVHAFSKNLFTRAMQKGRLGIFEGISKAKVPGNIFREGGPVDMSRLGQGNRLLAKTEGKRAAATRAAMKKQAAVIYHAGKKGAPAEDIGHALIHAYDRSFRHEAMPIAADQAKHLSELPSHIRDRFGYIADRKERPIFLEGTDTESIRKFTNQLGGRNALVKDPAKALKDENGNVLLVRRSASHRATQEIEGTGQLFDNIHRAPITVWKGLVLGLSPRYFVNNVVGNSLMLGFSSNPVGLTRGIIDSIRTVHGTKVAERSARRMNRIADAESAKWLPDEIIDQHFSYLQHGPLGMDAFLAGKEGDGLAHAVGKAKHANLYGVTEKVAYRATQRAGLMYALRSVPKVRQLNAHFLDRGYNSLDAFQAAARQGLKDPAVHAAVEKKVLDWAGQYYHLNGLEKKLTALVPFYTWDRHALRFAKTQVTERPAQSAMLAGLGREGDEKTKKLLGSLPDFMQGAIPVSGHAHGILSLILGGEVPGRQKVLLTSGLNPLAAAAEDAHAIASLIGAKNPGEAVGGQLNPLITGAIAGLTGQRVFSGARVHPKGGPVGEALTETFGSVPLANVLKAVIKGPQDLGKPDKRTGKRNPTLYRKDARQALSSLLGLSERDYSPEAAKRLFDQQHHVKKGRKRSSSFYG